MPKIGLPNALCVFSTDMMGSSAAITPARPRSSYEKPPTMTNPWQVSSSLGAWFHKKSTGTIPARCMANDVSRSQFEPGNCTTAIFIRLTSLIDHLARRYQFHKAANHRCHVYV